MFVDSLSKAAAAATQHGVSGPGPADASKVVAKGLGLSKAYVGQKSSFTVDCSKAGGQLPSVPPRKGWSWGSGSWSGLNSGGIGQGRDL